MEIDREKIKGYAIAFAVGAVISPIALVTAGFYHSSSALQSAAQTGANEVVVSYCVRDFLAADDAEERLAELKATTSAFTRTSQIRNSGFATLPGARTADRDVATQCAEQLFAS